MQNQAIHRLLLMVFSYERVYSIVWVSVTCALGTPPPLGCRTWQGTLRLGTQPTNLCTSLFAVIPFLKDLESNLGFRPLGFLKVLEYNLYCDTCSCGGSASARTIYLRAYHLSPRVSKCPGPSEGVYRGAF